MVALTLVSFYNFLQQSLLAGNTTAFYITSLLIRAHQKASTILNDNSSSAKKKLESRKPLHILYPARNSLLSSDSFFSTTLESSPRLESTAQTRTIIEHPSIIETNDEDETIVINKKKHLFQTMAPVTPNYKAPREPIVLCHGLFGFDVRGPQNIPALQFHYWAGVEDALAKLGAKIIVTKVPQTGSIWERSHALHTILKSILAGKKLNFVAHSMGGLDCRHLLATIKDRSYDVQSLTTVCTPHRGSPVMDWFRDHVGLGKSCLLTQGRSSSSLMASTTMTNNTNMTQRHESASFTTTTASSTVIEAETERRSFQWRKIDQLLVDWFDEPAYAHLTTDFCNDYFNPNTPDDPQVHYYSYGAAAKLPAWSSLLGMPWKMIYEKEGDNDGMVSVKSAQWGTYVKTIQADHWDLSGKSHIPYRLRTSKTENGQEFDRLEFYVELANYLYKQGH
ncbi:MAG: Alpha/Beta hydrolase protein [Benjaminiella poitrasii]|nr:MAG: Alpha/Beta hydrolase protein [Benjaminiella poitrasii]